MEASNVKIVLVALFIIGIAIYFSMQPNFEVILMVIAIAAIIFAWSMKEKIVMEGE